MAEKETDVKETESETAVVEPAETAEASTEESGGDTATSTRGSRKTRVGRITSDVQDKTVTVAVERQFAHPLYGKQVARTKKYHAHDEDNEYRTGDKVRIVETRPISKTKRWRVIDLLERPE